MTVSSSRTGKSRSVILHNVRLKESVLRTYLERVSMTSKPRRRLSNEQLKARLIVFIGVCLALVFAFSVLGMLYALIFVTQPIGAQAPNDKAFIDILTTLTVFLTGALGSVLASNGLKDKPSEKPIDTPKNTQDS
jgi:ABC-type Fe3+ transport system permease subunit